MSARLMVTGAVLGAVVAALLCGRGAAQVRDSGESGVFSTLHVGQMVDVRTDNIGIVVTVYEDPGFKEKLRSKVVEVGHDFLAVDYASPDGGSMEMRYPVTSITVVTHVKKLGERPGPKKRQ